MLFTQSRQNLLMGFVIGMYRNGGVFLGDTVKGGGNLLLIALCLGINRNRKAGGGEFYRSRGYFSRSRKGIARQNVAELCNRADVACFYAVGILLLAALEPHYLRKALFIARAAVYKAGIVFNLTRKHPEIRKLAYKRVGDRLKHNQGVFTIFVELLFLAVRERIVRIGRGGGDVKQSVYEHRYSRARLLNARENGAYITRTNALFKPCFNFLGGKVLAREIFFHKCVICCGDRLKQHTAHFVCVLAYGHTHFL